MHNAQQEIQWREILNEANSDPELNTVNVLLKRGIGIEDKDPQGETILLRAADRRTTDIKVIKDLIAAGADVNAKTRDGTTALHRAAVNGRLDIVKVLLEKGADPHALGRSKETALHRAAGDGHLDVVKFLLLQEGVKEKINAVDQYGETALHKAALYNRTEVIHALLGEDADINFQHNKGETALHKAVFLDSIEAINILLMYGADISLKNKNGKNPVDFAAGDTEQFMENIVESEMNRMKGVKIGTINYGDNQEDVSLHDFFIANRTKLVQYCSNSEICTHIRTNLKDICPMYYNAIREKLRKGAQSITCQTVITNFLKGGDTIQDKVTGEKKQVPSLARIAEHIYPKISQYFTDTEVQEIAKKILATTKS